MSETLGKKYVIPAEVDPCVPYYQRVVVVKDLTPLCETCVNVQKKGHVCGVTLKPCPYPSDRSSGYVRMVLGEK